MRDFYKLGLTACALVVAASNAALATDLGKGPNAVSGVITKSTCGSLSSGLKQGSPSNTQILYPGPRAKASLASPATSSTGKPGSATTTACVAKTATPSSGLNGATISFACYEDTDSGPTKSPFGTIKEQFKIAASHVPTVEQVTTTSTLYLSTSPTPTCSFTTDGTAVLE